MVFAPDAMQRSEESNALKKARTAATQYHPQSDDPKPSHAEQKAATANINSRKE
jgi:hypothetical protein